MSRVPCIRKMADSGDGVNSTSSGKEARGTISDGPITDPASSMKVNRAGLQSNLKSRVVPRAPSDVRVNLTVVCHNCHICRRPHDGVDRWTRPERAFNIIVDNCFLHRVSLALQKWKVSTFVSFYPSYLRWFFRIFLSFSVSLSLSFSPYVSPLFLLPSSVSVILITSSSPVFLSSRPTLWSLVTTCGSYVIGHMALIVISFIDEWALVKSCLYLLTRDTWQLWLEQVSSCSFPHFVIY